MSGPDLQEDSHSDQVQPRSQSRHCDSTPNTNTTYSDNTREDLCSTSDDIHSANCVHQFNMSSQQDTNYSDCPDLPSPPQSSLLPVSQTQDVPMSMMPMPSVPSTVVSSSTLTVMVPSVQTHTFMSQTSTTSTVSSGASEGFRRDSGYITEPSPFPHHTPPVTFFVEDDEEMGVFDSESVTDDDGVGDNLPDYDHSVDNTFEAVDADTFAESSTCTLVRRSSAISIPCAAEFHLVQQYLPGTPPRAYMCQESLHLGTPSNRAARMSTGSMPRTLSMILQDRGGQSLGGLSLPGSPATQSLMHTVFAMQEDALGLSRLRCHWRDQNAITRPRTVSESIPQEDDPHSIAPPVPRSRSNTMPTLPCLLERNFGQELRRISDEFHLNYTTSPPRVAARPASYPGSTTHRQQPPWWQLIIQVLSPRQRHQGETLSEESISQVVEAGKCRSDAIRFHRDHFPPH